MLHRPAMGLSSQGSRLCAAGSWQHRSGNRTRSSPTTSPHPATLTLPDERLRRRRRCLACGGPTRAPNRSAQVIRVSGYLQAGARARWRSATTTPSAQLQPLAPVLDHGQTQSVNTITCTTASRQHPGLDTGHFITLSPCQLAGPTVGVNRSTSTRASRDLTSNASWHVSPTSAVR